MSTILWLDLFCSITELRLEQFMSCVRKRTIIFTDKANRSTKRENAESVK